MFDVFILPSGSIDVREYESTNPKPTPPDVLLRNEIPTQNSCLMESIENSKYFPYLLFDSFIVESFPIE